MEMFLYFLEKKKEFEIKVAKVTCKNYLLDIQNGGVPFCLFISPFLPHLKRTFAMLRLYTFLILSFVQFS